MSDIIKHNIQELSLLIEALLLAAGRSMSIEEIMTICNEHSTTLNKGDVILALNMLEKNNDFRGIEIVKVANGYQFRTKKKYSHVIAKLWQEKPQKYSRALLETLALIIYRQPITRGEIEQIRGVAISSYIFKTLQDERGWIRVIGQKDVPGKPSLYATTKEFLTYFGLEKLEQLPALPEIANFLSKEIEIKSY